METFSTVVSPSVTVTVGMWASWNAFLLFFFFYKNFCIQQWSTVALFPGLMPSFCHLQYEKRGEGLDGFITWCVPLLMSHSVCSYLGLFSPFSFPEFSFFFLFCLSCESNCYSMWCQQWHASRDKSVQAFPRLLYCKRQKLGMEAWERG